MSSEKMDGNRKKVSICFLSKPNFNEYALKFLVLHLNMIQECFEFQFPEYEEYTIKKEDHHKSIDILKDLENVIKKNEIDGDYYIGITSSIVGANLWWASVLNYAVITTEAWQKYFVPPSVFEYILHSINTTLILMNDTKNILDSHRDTIGCCLDYTYYKMDKKIDIVEGYICDSCKTHIKETMGEKYLECFQKINSLEWLGEVNDRKSISSRLNKYFKINLDKDTGYYKSFWEKTKDTFPSFPKDILLIIISAITAAIVALIFSK